MNPAHKSRWALGADAPELSVVMLISMHFEEGVVGNKLS
jgi:hypothetical protein